MQRTQDIHVRSLTPLIAPRDIKNVLPLSEKACATVIAGRDAIRAIQRREDPRLIVVVGPCSIHDEQAAIEYAERLTAVAQRVAGRILVVMRVYFEKPRTTIGWKGLINDPHLDGSFDMSAGIHKAREILLRINEMGMPCATEMLDPISPQYTADLVTWASLGARTTESQTHRQMASGLSMPVGFKNGTDGSLLVAIDAMEAARHAHAFLGIDAGGQTCIVNTTGNPDGQLILRGGRSGPNYAPEHVAEARAILVKRNLDPHILVDCSHANSNKDYRNQPAVMRNVLEQRIDGNGDILGVMLESNLHEGGQPLGPDPSALKYGVSITDSCIGWEQTESLLDEACAQLAKTADVALSR